ncbi:MAG: PD-(D/E)XK nuclease family protein [Actinobacteria bacterium]|nr:PD-(D/E)XK nuclease family protein [Actinomycetota bacterium]
MEAPSLLTIAAYGPPAFDALRRALAAAKGDDPLAPVTVVPPSVYAGLSLRRALVHEASVINTRVLPLVRVADLLGSERLAATGRRPLTPAIAAAAVRLALDAAPGVLDAVADDPSTEDVVLSAFREVRELTDEQLDRLAAGGRRQADVVGLCRRARDFTRDFYDEPEVFEAAANAVRDGAPAARDIGAVILHVPHRLAAYEWPLVEALGAAGSLWAVVGHTGDDEADRVLAPLVTRLERILGPPLNSLGEAPLPSQVVVAPDPEEELRVVARQILAHIEQGGDPGRVGVVGVRGGAHALIAENVFAEAGVPFHGPARATLAQSVAGRTLLGALALPDARFARSDVMAWMAGAPIREAPGRGVVPAATWDRRSRQAGVTSGASRWGPRLKALADRLARRAEDAEGDGDGDAERAGRVRAAAAEAAAMAAFVETLAGLVAPPPERSWASFTTWAQGLLDRFLGGEGAHDDWPDHEIEAWRAVNQVLDALAVLDEIDPGPTVTRFRRALERALRVPAPRRRRFGEGVFVGPVSDAVGAAFDAVYVVGMVEGSFPTSGRPGALITDSDRELLEGALPGAAQRRLVQRLEWRAALASAPVSVCSVPATDPRAGRELHPSPWFLEVVTALHGEPVFGSTLPALAEAPWLLRVASPTAGLLSASTPASLREADLGALLAGERLPEIERGFEAIRGRLADAPGAWDGLIGEPVAHDADAVWSPTSLETWARCPFQYFLAHLLAVEALDEPEDIETLSALDRGSLVHEVMEQFVAEAGAIDPDRAWNERDHHRLDEILAQHFEEYERRGRTGRALLWDLEKQRLSRDLHCLLDHDAAYRSEHGVAPVAVEHQFPDADEPALEIPAGGRSVRLRGRIDRIDRAPDGSRLRVLDYKTGRPLAASPRKDPFAADPVIGGTRLQLPAYALAARRAFGEVPVTAHYWHVAQRHGFKLEGYDVTDAVLERFREVLANIVDGVESGVFPPNPGDEAWNPTTGRPTFEHCRSCAYDQVCPVDRDEAFHRKRGHEALEVYVRLAAPAPGDDGDEVGA